MTGGEGSLSRGTAKSVAAAAAAAATGPHGPLKSYPANRKAKKEALATGPHGSSKGSASATKRKAAKDPASCRMPRPRATGRKAKDVAQAQEQQEATALGAAEVDKFRRLSKADIRWLLDLKPMKPPARYAALKRSNPELTPQPGEEADEDKRRLYRLAKTFYELEENLPATQEWVRSELKNKGYVELDEERARHRAEVQALIDREWPAIEEKMKSLFLSQKENNQGGDESEDSDEGEDSDDESDDEEDEEY